MELGLKDKVVGITGAASVSGIGFAIAECFISEGARVFICDLNEAALKEAKAALGDVGAYAADVSSERDVSCLFDFAMADYGRIDIFINNAGIYPQAALREMTARQWDTVMGVNLRSVFLCTNRAASCMEKTGGVIINAASYAALIPSAGSGAYAASKAAVMSLTKTFAAELAPLGIRVNGFIPGVIETAMTQAVVESRRGGLEAQIALHRLGKPPDVAKAVAFLASGAADYMTGTFIEISGGKLCVQNPDYAYRNAGN